MNDSFKGRKSRGKKKLLKLIVAIEISQHYQLFLLATTYFLAYRDIWFPQLLTFFEKISAWTVSKYGVISGPYFPVPNLLRKSPYSIRIQENMYQK